MKLIPLTQGQFAMIDDADYEAVSAHTWHAQKSGGGFYAYRGVKKPNGKWTLQALHQFLMPGVGRIDHRDGNRLNDQRENLRPATCRQNGQGSQKKRLGTHSRFRGVTWHKRDLKWQAQINVNGKDLFLGYFTDEVAAAHAYDSAALLYFGEFASPNFDIGQITIT